MGAKLRVNSRSFYVGLLLLAHLPFSLFASPKRSYLEPLTHFIESRIQKNDLESLAAQEFTSLAQPLVFWTSSEEDSFVRNGLGLTETQLKKQEKISGSGFSAYVWTELSPEQKRLIAYHQTRNRIVEAPDLIQQLPLSARVLLNKYPEQVPEVERVSGREWALEIGWEKPITPEIESLTVWPQCYSAALVFHGLQKRPRAYMGGTRAREVYRGLVSLEKVLTEEFERIGFHQITERKKEYLRFGDVLLTSHHIQVFLKDNLVFEKPNGDKETPWRINEADLERLFKVSDLIILRK